MQLKDKIAELVKQSGLSNREISRRAGTTVNTVHRLRSGDDPRPDKLVGVARVFGVDLNWLMDDSLNWPPRKLAPLPDFDATLTPDMAQRHAILAREFGMPAVLAAGAEALCMLAVDQQGQLCGAAKMRLRDAEARASKAPQLRISGQAEAPATGDEAAGPGRQAAHSTGRKAGVPRRNPRE